MTIQQCKYVLEIVKTGSFTEAAKQLFVAQSTLSVSIKALEKELDIKIFERSANGIFLTEDGAEFVRYATKICNSNDIIMERYSNKGIGEQLSIATQHYDFIADIFGSFLKEVDNEIYRFSIREIKTHNVISDVETGKSDIGIIGIRENDYEIMKRYLAKRNVSFNSVLNVSPHVFFRKGHPLSKYNLLTGDILKDYPYVSYAQGENNSSFFAEEVTDVPSANKQIEISDRATLMNVLMLTDSFTVGTGIMPSALNKGDIISIPLESDEKYIIGYLLNQERRLTDIAKKFLVRLENTLKNI